MSKNISTSVRRAQQLLPSSIVNGKSDVVVKLSVNSTGHLDNIVEDLKWILGRCKKGQYAVTITRKNVNSLVVTSSHPTEGGELHYTCPGHSIWSDESDASTPSLTYKLSQYKHDAMCFMLSLLNFKYVAHSKNKPKPTTLPAVGQR